MKIENLIESFHSTHATLKKFGYRGGGKDGEWSGWISDFGRGKNKIMLHKDGEEWVNHSPDNPSDVLASGRGQESLIKYLNKFHHVSEKKDDEKKPSEKKTVKEEILNELKLRPFSDYENWKKEAEARGLRIHIAGKDDWQSSDKDDQTPYLYIARDKMGNRHGKFNQSQKSGHLREDLYMQTQALQEDYKSGKKVFAHLDDTPDNHRHRMIHSLTAYDSTQQQRAAANPRAYHNPHALSHYMKAADEAYQSMKAGMAPADAINKHFVGYVADRLHKHLGTGGTSIDSQRRKMFGEDYELSAETHAKHDPTTSWTQKTLNVKAVSRRHALDKGIDLLQKQYPDNTHHEVKIVGTNDPRITGTERKLPERMERKIKALKEALELSEAKKEKPKSTCPNCGATRSEMYKTCLACLKPVNESVDEYGEISPFTVDKKKEDQKARLRKMLQSLYKKKRRSIRDEVADAIGLKKYKHPDGGYRYEEIEDDLDNALVTEADKPLIHAIEHGDHVTIVDRFGQKRSGKAVMRSSHGGWVLNMGGRHGTPGLADDSNIVHVRKVRRTQEKDFAHKLLGNVREEGQLEEGKANFHSLHHDFQDQGFDYQGTKNGFRYYEKKGKAQGESSMIRHKFPTLNGNHSFEHIDSLGKTIWKSPSASDTEIKQHLKSIKSINEDNLGHDEHHDLINHENPGALRSGLRRLHQIPFRAGVRSTSQLGDFTKARNNLASALVQKRKELGAKGVRDYVKSLATRRSALKEEENLNEETEMKKGSELHPEDQKHVLNSYVHRYTKEHKPNWANKLRPDGTKHMPQFHSDSDWLNNTKFRVHKKSGRLDHRAKSCESNPTWPHGQNQLKEDHFEKGAEVEVPHKGKMVKGKIVRSDKGDMQSDPFYVVDVGEYASIKVPHHKVRMVSEEREHCDDCGRKTGFTQQDPIFAVDYSDGTKGRLCKDCRSKSGKDLKIFDKNHHYWDDEKRRQEMRRKGWIR